MGPSVTRQMGRRAVHSVSVQMDRCFIKKLCLDGNMPEVTVPTETQSLTELGPEPVFFKGLSVVQEGSHFKVHLFKVLLKLC